MNHKLDTDTQVFFYEQEFYVLSNFSAFAIEWCGLMFPTAEQAYHWSKFQGSPNDALKHQIRTERSAHEAFKLAQSFAGAVRQDWPKVRVGIMLDILRAKANQHEYVRRKLLETGDRELIEDSWRDGFWGWGPNKDGENALGKLWMEIRQELRESK